MSLAEPYFDFAENGFWLLIAALLLLLGGLLVASPLMAALRKGWSALLSFFGRPRSTQYTELEIQSGSGEKRPQDTENETKHPLISGMFDFEDRACRSFMVPRADIVFFDVRTSTPDCLALARQAKHTRYPLCDGSLDNLVGVVHLKDLATLPSQEKDLDLRAIARPVSYVPESMPVSGLLRHFQSLRQHLALVIDEYGTVIGLVTLADVLETIVGPVDDDYEVEPPVIVPDGPGTFLVLGSAPIEVIENRLGLKLNLRTKGVETLSGALVALAGRFLAPGERIQLRGAVVEVLSVKGVRAARVRIILQQDSDKAA